MGDYDLVIVGAGVAGLTAAITAGRHGLKVAIVDRMGAGGQITPAEKIENFPGFPYGIAGFEFGPLLYTQAEAAGAEVMLGTVETIDVDGSYRIVRTDAETLRARAVIVAAGSALRSLGVPGEEKLTGKGVSHCASCDAPFFKGQDVVVVGGGDTALDEALTLIPHVATVTVIHRGPALVAQRTLVERATASKKVTMVFDTVVEEIFGENAVSGVRLRDVRLSSDREHKTSGVFVCVGLAPNTSFLNGVLTLDAEGRIVTDVMMRASVDGIFAAGDIRAGSVALLPAVAGDGATAAIAAHRYIATGG